MTTVLAFPVYLNRPEAAAVEADTTALDLSVIFTLCTLFFLLGCFATWAWLIWRRTERPEPHLRLMMEMDQNKEQETSDEVPTEEAPRDPWERPTDWWKRE